MNNLTQKQKELLIKFAEMHDDLVEECENDENFNKLIEENNDLITKSLDDLSAEWRALAK